tara:strand:+ start:96 stop:560 length:465 start_codon:yes stop_codon:yes gene_type:complete
MTDLLQHLQEYLLFYQKYTYVCEENLKKLIGGSEDSDPVNKPTGNEKVHYINNTCLLYNIVKNEKHLNDGIHLPIVNCHAKIPKQIIYLDDLSIKKAYDNTKKDIRIFFILHPELNKNLIDVSKRNINFPNGNSLLIPEECVETLSEFLKRTDN